MMSNCLQAYGPDCTKCIDEDSIWARGQYIEAVVAWQDGTVEYAM